MSALPESPLQTEFTSFLLDEIARLTGFPREQLHADWLLEDDFGFDWAMKGLLLSSAIDWVSQRTTTRKLPEFRFDEIQTLGDIMEIVGGVPEVREPNLLPGDVELPQIENPFEGMFPELPLPILPLSGTPHEMGVTHAMGHGLSILRIMQKMRELIGPRLDNLPELEDVLEKRDRYFSPTELEELEGAAEGMGLPIRHMIALNVGLYPEYLPGCTQFAIRAGLNGDDGMVHAVNEDSPVALMLRDDLTRIAQVRRPDGGIPCLTFSIVGQIGGLNGVNAAGISVSSTILLDCPLRQETRYGCVHPILVRRVLEQADSIEAAIEIVKASERAGAWSLCFTDASQDRICYLEYDGARLAVQDHLETLVTSNHCLMLESAQAPPEHSLHRFGRLNELLGWNNALGISPERAKELLRDRYDPGRGRETRFPTMSTLRRVDNQGSIVMSPGQGELWITPGPMEKDRADVFYHIDVQKLLSTPFGKSREANEQAMCLPTTSDS